MAVGPGLVEQQPYSRSMMSRGDLKFGGFRVTGMTSEAGSESHSGDWFPDDLSHGSGYDDFGFQLEEDGAPPRRVSCAARMASDTVHEGNLSLTSTTQSLKCDIWLDPAHRETHARLELGDGGKGSLTAAGRSLTLEGRDFQNRSRDFDPIGYALIDGRRDLVVVQKVNGGAVWFAADAGADRPLLAAAAAAILLYEPPK
jgi:hypothetical protein